MMKVASDIVRAQEALKQQHGEDAYREFIAKAQQQITKVAGETGMDKMQVNLALIKYYDAPRDAAIKLIYIAALGE